MLTRRKPKTSPSAISFGRAQAGLCEPGDSLPLFPGLRAVDSDEERLDYLRANGVPRTIAGEDMLVVDLELDAANRIISAESARVKAAALARRKCRIDGGLARPVPDFSALTGK